MPAKAVVRYGECNGAATRVLTKDLPCINSLAIEPRSGKLYASRVFLGDAMWEIEAASGAITIINSEFKVPAAANLDGKGNLWVIDTQTGELSCVALANGRKTVGKKLTIWLEAGLGLPPPYGVAGVAVAPNGTACYSADRNNAIQRVRPQR